MEETLNEVSLFLPRFKRENVETVMKVRQNEEGCDIPADVESEQYGNDRINSECKMSADPRPQS